MATPELPASGAHHADMASTDLSSLHGQSVLVRYLRDTRNPPIAMRGSLLVEPGSAPAERPTVKLVIDFPEMMNTSAHQRTVTLSDVDLAKLKPAERGGFEFSTDHSFT